MQNSKPIISSTAHGLEKVKIKDIERLRYICCSQEFLERKATLLENSKISAKIQEQMLKRMRWGVCDEGIADICEVSIKTVRLNQAKAASHVLKHHDFEVKNIKDAGVQLDEMHCKATKDRSFWLGTSICMQSLLSSLDLRKTSN